MRGGAGVPSLRSFRRASRSRRVKRFGKASAAASAASTGYRGRLGVYELLALTEPLRELVMRRSSSAAIASAAMAEGALATLREDAFAKVRLGETSLAEALRVVPA